MSFKLSVLASSLPVSSSISTRPSSSRFKHQTGAATVVWRQCCSSPHNQEAQAGHRLVRCLSSAPKSAKTRCFFYCFKRTNNMSSGKAIGVRQRRGLETGSNSTLSLPNNSSRDTDRSSSPDEEEHEEQQSISGTGGSMGLDLGAAGGGLRRPSTIEREDSSTSKNDKKGRSKAGTDAKSKKKGGSSLRERIRSPLLGAGAQLEELREQFSKSVEDKFAPLHIPPHRRMQTAAVATWALLPLLCLVSFLICMSFPPLWPILVPYIIWIQFDKAPHHGGRPKQWCRRLPMWKYFANYYPASIVKEADLPPDRPYLFGYHPHGIIGMGAFATFATEGTGFSDYFPGIQPHLLTLDSNFKFPFYRDIMMAHGVCSVSKRSCRNILAQGPGSSITIVIGGAAESLSAHPGTADLTLKKRFGFIKIAIREGADLVPVFSFGENDVYDQLANKKGSLVYSLQKKFQKVFGFTLPLFYGRGIFNYNYGLMPFRHPIVSVFGKPISVKRDPHPSDEVVQEVQQRYIDELMSIWDKYKDLYARNRTKELTLVD